MANWKFSLNKVMFFKVQRVNPIVEIHMVGSKDYVTQIGVKLGKDPIHNG